MEVTFLELRSKEVVNIIDGRKLGRIIDVLFDTRQSRICGVIVPGERSFNFFKRCDDILVPWKNIIKIGEDVILVELFLSSHRGGVKNQRRLYEGEILEDECNDVNRVKNEKM